MYQPFKGNFGDILGRKVYVKIKDSYVEGEVILYSANKYNVKCEDGKFRKVKIVYQERR